jgi:predicted DNA-binding protein (MmcQ/YjbR family)
MARYCGRMAADPHHERLKKIIARLPEAVEDTPWGSIHWKVRGKIFGGWGRDAEDGSSIGFKTDKELQAMLVRSDPRFSIAAYVGKHGWVDMKLGDRPDWSEVEHFIVESYKMIAPAKLAAQVGGGAAAAAAPARKPAAKKPARRRAAKPTRKPSSSGAKKPRRTPVRG